MSELIGVDVLALDYHGKTQLLEKVVQELLDLRIEYSKVAGRAAELNANVQVLREVKSALQTAIRAEGFMT